MKSPLLVRIPLSIIALAIASVTADSTCLAKNSVSSSVMSQYLGPNADVFSEESVIQSEFSTDFGTQWIDATIWNSTEVGGGGKGFSPAGSNETDYIVGLSKAVNESVTVRAWAEYWDLNEMFSAKPMDIYVAGASISKRFNDTAGVKLMFERFFRTNQDVSDGYNRVTIRVPLSWDLGKKVTLNATPSVAYDQGSPSLEAAYIGRLIASLDWQATDRLSISLLKLNAVGTLSSVDDRRPNGISVAGGVGASFVF